MRHTHTLVVDQGAKQTETAKKDDDFVPLREPRALARVRGRDLIAGVHLPPVQRLRAFSPDQVETLVEHWMYDTRRSMYNHIVEYGGAGDKGRDRAGYVGAVGTAPWDNYQCKQYEKKLAPSDLWLELGKLVFHVSAGAFACPRTYYFVAAQGFGPTAVDLLGSPDRVRKGLRKNWATYCADLCKLNEIKDALEVFAFPEFVPITGARMIEELQGSPIYPQLFGGGLTKPRPVPDTPPDEIAPSEMAYIRELVAAYDDHSEECVPDATAALAKKPYSQHLRESRREFYSAESLREFSKDVVLDPSSYLELQTLMHGGIKFTIARPHPSGYDRVLAACEQAMAVQLGDHVLAGDLSTEDRAGICHQLANDGRIKWIDEPSDADL